MEYTNPRQVKLKRCSIFSPTLPLRAPNATVREELRTQGVDIAPNVVSLDIYESIFQNTISGKLEIRETRGYPEYLPLTGTELILIEFETTYQQVERSFRRVFRARRLINQSFPKNEDRVYTIELVTPEFMNSLSSRITRKYKDTTSIDAVRDIMQKDLIVPAAILDNTEFETTAGKIDALLPNYTPLQAINYLSLLSLTDTTPPESNFVFFETLDGFFFKSIRKMIVDGKQNQNIPEFTVNANQLTGSASVSEDAAYNSIIKLHQEELFDIVKDTVSGMLRSKMLYLDFLARKWNEEDTRYTETFDKTTHLSDYPVYPKNFDQLVSRNVKLFVVPTNSTTANSKYVDSVGETITPQRLYEAIVLRNRQMKEIQHIRTVLEVPGQPNIRAGKLVRVNYPSSRVLDDVDTNPHAGGQPQNPSPLHSGLHLITHVRHQMTQVTLGVMQYHMHIEVVRDSLNQPLDGYDADTSDVDGKAQ